MWDENGKLYRMCVVGNIIGEHYFGVNKEIKSGTKHFSPGTKAYCIFMYGGMGHQKVRVLARLRNSTRMADIILSTKMIKNYRLKKVFNPSIIEFIDKYSSIDDTEDIANSLFETLNKNHREIIK